MLAIKDRSKFLAVTGAVVLTALANGRASGDASHRVGSETGREIPRFVSIKASPANVRYGPSMKHDIKWTFARRSVPVEVLADSTTGGEFATRKARVAGSTRRSFPPGAPLWYRRGAPPPG